MERIVIEYGDFLKGKRLAKGYSQAHVAELLGITQQSYSLYELGKREPGLDFIIDVAKVLGFKPGEFFDKHRG
jgi:transcriptional regulator with XRE-family HTH domain